MAKNIKEEIQALIDLETECWNKQNIDPFISIIHPDMVWPWPPNVKAHDPAEWVFVMGRFDNVRWRNLWNELFAEYLLVHNIRNTIKIEISNEEDGALAVVDIDTLWRNKKTNENLHWKGRVGKIYTKMKDGSWKLISHIGALEY